MSVYKYRGFVTNQKTDDATYRKLEVFNVPGTVYSIAPWRFT